MECMYKIDGSNYDFKNFIVNISLLYNFKKKEAFSDEEDFGDDFKLRLKALKADKFTYKEIRLTEGIIKEERHIMKDFTKKCKNKTRLGKAF